MFSIWVYLVGMVPAWFGVAVLLLREFGTAPREFFPAAGAGFFAALLWPLLAVIGVVAGILYVVDRISPIGSDRRA